MKAFFSFFILFPVLIQAQSIFINEFQSSNNYTLQDEFLDSPDWIELFNAEDTTVNLQGYYLSDDPLNKSKWVFPNVDIAPHGFLLVFASGDDFSEGLHANFKISSSGESIYFSDAALNLVDHTAPVPLQSDRSYGREVDGSNTWVYMYAPSPEETNAYSTEEVKDISFSHFSGFYEEPFYLKIDTEGEIRYSLNGESPEVDNPIFPDSLHIGINTDSMEIAMIPTSINVLNEGNADNILVWRKPSKQFQRAQIITLRAFVEGKPASDPVVFSYFVGEFDVHAPIVSLVSDSSGLFSYTDGVYVPGIDYVEGDAWTGNYYRRGEESERNASLQYFNEGGELLLDQNLGIRIHGGGTRAHPQKSFRLKAENRYSHKKDFDHTIFPNQVEGEFKHLILRSKFTSWWNRNVMFQEEFVHRLVKKADIDLDAQSDKPVFTYLNGEFWGIQVFRERLDEHYLEEKYDLDDDHIDLVNGNGEVDYGSSEAYLDLIEYVIESDPETDDFLNHVEDRMDLGNCIDYFIIQSYFGNIDWPQNNMKLWRETDDSDGRWRFLLYDMDAAFMEPEFDPFSRLKDLEYDQALFFMQLLNNDEFIVRFLSRYNYFLNEVFVSSDMLKIVDEFYQEYAPFMEMHIARWGNPLSKEHWEKDVQFLRTYLLERNCYIREYLSGHFGESNIVDVCGDTDETHFMLYPNPSTGQFNIKLYSGFDGENQISVFDLNGRLVGMEKCYNGGGTMDISNLEKGTYIIAVKSMNGEESSKLFVLK